MLKIAPDRFNRLERAALDYGGWKTSSQTLFLDLAGRCESPVCATFEYRQSWFDALLRAKALGQPLAERVYARGHRYAFTGPYTGPSWYQDFISLDQVFTWERVHSAHPRWVDVRYACRHCHACLKARAYLWRRRAEAEIKASSRTWFCTFTLRPEARTIMVCRASQRLRYSVDTLSDNDWFREVFSEVSKEFTLYMKRVRKQSGARVRFICVAECHLDGWPHMHALIHESDKAIPKSLLQEQWRLGFSSAKLCDFDASRYVSKYLAKQSLARVRASLRYGTSSDIISLANAKMM